MLELTVLEQWSPPQLAYLATSIGLAGFVRGYSGFGFALAAAPMLTVILEPVDAIPIVLLFEIVLTLGFLPSIIGLVHWSAVRWLVLGAVLGTPFGVYILSAVPADSMRFGLAFILLGSVLLSWRRPPAMSGHFTPLAKVGIGVLSGLLSGGTAMSGPPIVLYFLASPVGATVGRASMMMFFLCSALIAMVFGISADLYSLHTFVLAILSIPILLVGAALGALCFHYSGPTSYRHFALMMLVAIAVFALGHAIIHHLGRYTAFAQP